MKDQQFDETLRHLAGDPEPTQADREVSRRALTAAIADAHNRTVGWRRRLLAPGLTGGLIALVVVAAVLVSEIGRPSIAEAALGEIAHAAERIDPLAIPPQQYAYSRSEQVVEAIGPAEAFDGARNRPLAYLLPVTREVWVADDGTVQLRISADIPQFFSEQDRADYYAAGFDKRDNLGTTVTQTFSDATSIVDEREWPNDPTQLKAMIIETLNDSDERPLVVQILDRAIDLIREPATPPSLRATVLRVIGELDLTLSERTGDGGGTFTTTYDTPERTTISLTIDGEGQLRHESITLLDGDSKLGIPPGTVIDDATYEPIRLVDSLDKPDNP